MAAAEATATTVIDVRTIPPFERHPKIFGTIETLKPDELLEIVSDHEPAPLHYQVLSRYADLVSWEYVERGPTVWRVRIGKAAAPEGCGCCCG